MRKLLLCLPMMTLLLAACGPAGASREEQLALVIRGEYLEMSACAARMAVTADYGQRIYQFEMDAALEGEQATLTLTAPETVAGITATISGPEGRLEYGGVSVETGSMDPEGLSPVSAFPALMDAARSGYITACALEEEGGLLRVDCGDPEGAAGEGREISLWFDAAGHGLVRGEISVDGFRAILCEFSSFTME